MAQLSPNEIEKIRNASNFHLETKDKEEQDISDD
jgi:hypothetical protein